MKKFLLVGWLLFAGVLGVPGMATAATGYTPADAGYGEQQNLLQVRYRGRRCDRHSCRNGYHYRGPYYRYHGERYRRGHRRYDRHYRGDGGYRRYRRPHVYLDL